MEGEQQLLQDCEHATQVGLYSSHVDRDRDIYEVCRSVNIRSQRITTVLHELLVVQVSNLPQFPDFTSSDGAKEPREAHNPINMARHQEKKQQLYGGTRHTVFQPSHQLWLSGDGPCRLSVSTAA
jgi:hypothetical protein